MGMLAGKKLLVTGLLILAITVFGTIAVSCSGDDGRQATEMRSR